jgi:hypothetical protein
LKKVLREYLPEIIAVVVALLGIFLLVERMQIRQTLAAALLRLLNFLKELFASLGSNLGGFFSRLTLSNAIGWILILFTCGYILWRLRYRFAHSARMLAGDCPRCGGELRVVHRKPLDRFIAAVFLPRARRYRCTNKECNWTGLRRSPERSRRLIQPD